MTLQALYLDKGDDYKKNNPTTKETSIAYSIAFASCLCQLESNCPNLSSI